MTALAETSLLADERILIERFVSELRERLSGELHAVWLFGSSARGEEPSVESAPAEEAQRAIALAHRFLTAIEALFD